MSTTMENIQLKIPEITYKNDFTIIYKGKEEQDGRITEPIVEIQTSKDELIRKLRYFKNKAFEINQMNEILIHDKYPISVFKEFINTVKTNIININESNYTYFYELSSKYEYNELQKEIEAFSQKRPDVQNIVNEYSDYLEMSNEEMDEFLNNECFSNVFNCQHSKEMMKSFHDERKINEKRISTLETKNAQILNDLSKEINERKNQQQLFEKYLIKLEETISQQKLMISEYRQENND